MFLTKYKDSGASVCNTTNVCPQCGAPMKYRGIITSIVRLLIIVFLIIPIGIGVFLTVHHLVTSNAISSQAPTKPMQNSTLGCSPSDIEIKSLVVKFVDACRTSSCLYMKGAAVMNNRCSVPVGVQIKITAYDNSGSPIATRDLWPADTDNIPPGDYTFSLDSWLDYEPGMASVEVSPISVKQWRR
jgi:hypothetical protein